MFFASRLLPTLVVIVFQVAPCRPDDQTGVGLSLIDNITKPFLKSFSEGQNNPTLKGLIDLIVPSSTTSTTTTTTSTQSPIQHLTKTIVGGPAQVFGSVLKGSLDATKATSELVGLKPAAPEDESVYYEYGPVEEPFSVRRPKYFSKECNFRFACEMGKFMKPLSTPVKVLLEKSKFVQDIQNRYTRAVSYGLIYGECERYYCVLVQLLGGPTQFASGMLEILNKIANPDL